MSHLSGIGLPGRVKIRKPRRITRATQAQRIRFGILAAREILERQRLTEWQQDYIEGCEAAGWGLRDSRKAFERERFNARRRAFVGRVR